MDDPTVRARRTGKTGMVAIADAPTPEIAEFMRQVFRPGRDPFDVIADITDALEGQDNVLRTIRPDDPAPDIARFQQVTDELKPKTNGNGKARNGQG